MNVELFEIIFSKIPKLKGSSNAPNHVRTPRIRQMIPSNVDRVNLPEHFLLSKNINLNDSKQTYRESEIMSKNHSKSTPLLSSGRQQQHHQVKQQQQLDRQQPAQQKTNAQSTNHSRRLLEFIQQKKTKETNAKQKVCAGNNGQRKCVLQTKLAFNNSNNNNSNNANKEKPINLNGTTNNRNSNSNKTNIECSNRRSPTKITSSHDNGNNSSKNKSSISVTKSIGETSNKNPSFVPSKRTIQHHDYQNVVDDVTSHQIPLSVQKKSAQSISAAAGGATNALNIYDSAAIVHNGNNNKNGTYKSPSPKRVLAHDKRYDDNNNDTSNGTNQNKNNNNSKHHNNRINSDAPIYRRFGDTTNLLRNNGKSTINYNVLTTSSNSTSTTASTAIVENVLPSKDSNNNNKRMYTNYAQNDNECYLKSRPQPKQHHQHNLMYSPEKHHANPKQSHIISTKITTAAAAAAAPNGKPNSILNSDIFRLVKTQNITCNMTNDTGFSSMDPDNSSTVTPPTKKQNHYYSPFNQIDCINYDVKNRIQMFDVDSSPSSYRLKCHNNYNSAANPHIKR